MKIKSIIPGIWILLLSLPLLAGETSFSISPERIPTGNDLLNALKKDVPGLTKIYQARDAGDTETAIRLLLDYLKEQVKSRYYFNYENFPERFSDYRDRYPGQEKVHFELARYHASRFAPETQWRLPFNNLKNEPVTAYELRHLARQQKSMDMTLVHFYSGGKESYLDYFLQQVADLNRAFLAGEYDDAGNGIYESFRAGKRIHNWLFNHHAYLALPEYTRENQLLLIRTFLHHGSQLQKRTEKFRYGNHHTGGLVALFEVAALFTEFEITERWRQQAMEGLKWHLTREINADGFQFERSVHYHKGDIENYFRVYQLAKLNGYPISPIYEEQFRKMFTVLVHLAQPNKKLPVLQDDTDSPFRENNDMDDVMTIGSILFEDRQMRYLAGERIPAGFYWLLRRNQIRKLTEIPPQKPDLGSIALEETGYYIMRNGWNKSNQYMVISAGLSKQKPDHQHGEMLGIVAWSHGNEILPNYQVKYNLPDFPFWKSSWVKNVALVDSLPLGRRWTPNRGGSGFGKWAILPKPEVFNWITDGEFDYFLGSHNGYDTLQVGFQREILFIKDGFWIVRDHFSGMESHQYQQIWQGHYSVIHPGSHIRSSFSNGAGLDIVQLNPKTISVQFGRFREKGNAVFSCEEAPHFTYTTLLFPFENAGQGLPQNIENDLMVNRWQLHLNSGGNMLNLENLSTDAFLVLDSGNNLIILLDVNSIRKNNREIRFKETVSVVLQPDGKFWKVKLLNKTNLQAKTSLAVKIRDEQNKESTGKNLNIKKGITIEWL